MFQVKLYNINIGEVG